MELPALLFLFMMLGFMAGVLDYYDFEDMMEEYNTRFAGVNGSTSDS